MPWKLTLLPSQGYTDTRNVFAFLACLLAIQRPVEHSLAGREQEELGGDGVVDRRWLLGTDAVVEPDPNVLVAAAFLVLPGCHPGCRLLHERSQRREKERHPQRVGHVKANGDRHARKLAAHELVAIGGLAELCPERVFIHVDSKRLA